VDRDLINQSVYLGESLKLSLNMSFTLDSTGSNPVHSNKDLLQVKRQFFLSSINDIITFTINDFFYKKY